MNVLEVEDLVVEFDLPEGALRAVDGASFRVPAGRSVALVGESGSGKSVISQAIMGILPKSARITRGSIHFHDPATGLKTDIAKLDRGGRQMRAIRGDRISIIFQEPMTSLSPLHTVGDQVSEAIRIHRGVSDAEAREITAEMLELVSFPDPKRALRTYPFELSGGLRQRAMIAMALVCRPALLIADEPTTALDVTIQAQILKLINDLQHELNMAMLMITHDLGVVANVASEVVVAYHGRILECGMVEDIFRAPRHAYLNALLGAVPSFHMAQGERLKPIRPIDPHPGSFLRAPRETTVAHPPGEALLQVESLTKTFTLRKSGPAASAAQRSVRALDDVSFEVKRGECLGIVGESGCGKTTTAKIIMRAVEPTSGAVRFRSNGALTDVTRLEGEALMDYRRRVQFVFQDPFSSLNPRMTVYDILSEPFIIHRVCNEAERFERVKELMAVVGLDIRHLRRYPHSFSGGQRQRIGIARALALRPELILCDEPVSALDVSVQAQVLNLLKDLQAELGLTYLFISHNLAVVDYIADRIAVMCRGRLVELAPAATLVRNHVHPYTRALFAAVPEPDLDHPLDFSALMRDRTSVPEAWEAPFTLDLDTEPVMVEIEPEHFVCAPGWADRIPDPLREAV